MKGFTLIEILVSVAIFSVVMVVALGALLALSVADRKAESIKTATNNLDFALDSMARAIRTGNAYHCGSTSGQDCASPGSDVFYFTSQTGSQTGVLTGYQLDTSNASVCGQTSGTVGCIERNTSTNGGLLWSGWQPITAPEIIINNVGSLFYVVGSCPGSGGSGFCPPSDTTQPKVVMDISGYVQVSATEQTTFHLQTTVTQRIYDQ